MTPVSTFGNLRGSFIASVIGITYNHRVRRMPLDSEEGTYQTNAFK